MTLRSGLAFVGFLGVFSLVFVGCGDDDENDGPNKGGKGGSSAGEGGEATGGVSGTGTGGRGGTATGGRGGTAGAGGRGGTAGAGGRGGTAGAAGDATGGLAGDAGGGALGGEGGDGGVGGVGGAGEAGMGGVPDTTADSCKYECVDDDDCLVGTSTAYKCHPQRKRCEDPNFVCDAHDDCIAMASGWLDTCVDDLGCDVGFEACIDLAGSGRCAETPFPGVGCFNGTERMMPAFGASGMVAVCGSDAGRCDDRGACFKGCTESPCGAGLTCNSTTGLCECDADGECTAMGVSRCNMTTHLCECQSNTDCTVSGTNECVSGRCGCASVAVCSATLFPNATPRCE